LQGKYLQERAYRETSLTILFIVDELDGIVSPKGGVGEEAEGRSPE